MKINFGHKIAIGYSLFVLFILAFVVTSFQFNFDLDEEDYYAKEVVFEEEIQAVEAFNQLEGDIKIEQGNRLMIHLPTALAEQVDLEYSLLFKRPSDKRLDWRFQGKAQNGIIQLTWDDLVTGLYIIELDFEMNGATFHYESDYFLNPIR